MRGGSYQVHIRDRRGLGWPGNQSSFDDGPEAMREAGCCLRIFGYTILWTGF